MSNEFFTDEEMKKHKITDYIYRDVHEKCHVTSDEKFSVWDYRDNHMRFRDCLEAKQNGKVKVFDPFLPLVISHPITRDSLFKK